MTETAKPWKHPEGNALALLNTAHDHALKYEPHPGAPGVDIDAIHYKLGAVTKRRAA